MSNTTSVLQFSENPTPMVTLVNVTAVYRLRHQRGLIDYREQRAVVQQAFTKRAEQIKAELSRCLGTQVDMIDIKYEQGSVKVYAKIAFFAAFVSQFTQFAEAGINIYESETVQSWLNPDNEEKKAEYERVCDTIEKTTTEILRIPDAEKWSLPPKVEVTRRKYESVCKEVERYIKPKA